MVKQNIIIINKTIYRKILAKKKSEEGMHSFSRK